MRAEDNSRSQNRFQWNLGGFMGTGVGLSAWMAAVPFASSWPREGILISSVAVGVVMVTALILWSRRHHLLAINGSLILLSVAAGVTLGWLITAYLLDLRISMSWKGTGKHSPLSFLWCLLIFPALAVLFLFVNRPSNAA